MTYEQDKNWIVEFRTGSAIYFVGKIKTFGIIIFSVLQELVENELKNI